MGQKKLVLIGAGDFVREIMYTALEQHPLMGGDTFKPIAFIDKDPQTIGKKLEGISIVSFDEMQRMVDKNTCFIAATGFPELREIIIRELLSVLPYAKFVKVIHRSAIIMPNTRIEDGVYI